MDKQLIFFGFFAGFLGLTLAGIYKKYKQTQRRQFVLVGDIGGTNIRLRFDQTSLDNQELIVSHRTECYPVKDFNSLSDAVQVFLKTCQKIGTPRIAVLGIAGLLIENKVRMANVPKWGQIDGNQLGKRFNINRFYFIDDFQAATYGVSSLKQQNLTFIKGEYIQQGKPRGVIGAGTGLGASILFESYVKGQKIINVLPTEQGQSDYFHIDQETEEYYRFLQKRTGKSFINIERSFCGPAIPLMFQFFTEKSKGIKKEQLQPTSFQIIQYCIKNKEKLNQENPYFKTVNLFLKIYENVIGNFIAHHMCTGGVYLCGNLSRAVLPIIQKDKFLNGYLRRHPQIQEAVKNTPIVVCMEGEFGLEGALKYSKKMLKRKLQQKFKKHI